MANNYPKHAPDRASQVSRAVQAVAFVHQHKCWTVSDLAEHLNVSHATATRYFHALSLHLPVREVRGQRFLGDRGGSVGALYSVRGAA